MSDAVLKLPASVDAATAAAVRAELLERRGADLTVDASEVRRFGGLGLQLLLAGARAWASDGRAFRIADPSPAFTEALRLTGAADLPEFAS